MSCVAGSSSSMRLAESTASNMNLHLRERWHSFCHSQFVADLKVALVVWSVIVWLIVIYQLVTYP